MNLYSQTKEKLLRSVFYIKQALIKEKTAMDFQKEELSEIIKVLAHSIVSNIKEIEIDNPESAKKYLFFRRIRNPNRAFRKGKK
ncbi:MAG: hypothetical protein MTP17_00960 [Candidatus Midichloria sp.]|nr:MAG: hypothetical protein MTP17_00960 [Candidatus Midichloria sp.]